jgi:plastocyanin
LPLAVRGYRACCAEIIFLEEKKLGDRVTRNLIAMLVAFGMLLVAPANAGTISGKIRLANVSGPVANQAAGGRENVVIWLEGVHDAKPPEAPLKISQRNLQFAPDFAIAVMGQKVDMPNDDDVVHNVYSFTGTSPFNLGLYGKGEMRTVSFEQAGIVDVFCSIHHQMHARVFVVPTKYFATTLPGHSFTMTDVPPGKYVLKVWHERSHMIEKAVVVPASGVVISDILLEAGAQAATSAKK